MNGITMAQRYKRKTWLDRVPGRTLARVVREVEADAEPAIAIYRRWNLCRYLADRTFRLFAAERRRKIREYETARRRARWAAKDPVPAEQQRGGGGERGSVGV